MNTFAIIAMALFSFNSFAIDDLKIETCDYENKSPSVYTIKVCSEQKFCSGPVLCQTQGGKIEKYETFCKQSKGVCPSAQACLEEFLKGENFYVIKTSEGQFDFDEPPFENMPQGFKPVKETIYTFDKPGTQPKLRESTKKTKKERKDSF